MKPIALKRISLIYAWLLAFLLIIPLLPLLIQSFAFRWFWPDLLPDIWWWQKRGQGGLPFGWDYVLSPYSHLMPALLNTLIIGIAVTLISLLICFPAARAMVRHDFKFKQFFQGLFSFPLLVPEIVLVLSLVIPFIYLDIAGTLWSVITVQLVPAIPYMMRILVTMFQVFDHSIEDQARLLGASRFQTFRYISLPFLLPGVIAACLFTFLVSSNLFLVTFLIGQGKVETLPTLLFAKISGGTVDAAAAGLTLIALLPGFALLVVMERYLSEFTK